MDTTNSDAIDTFRWGLRRYIWLFLICVEVVFLLVPAYRLRQSGSYDATATVAVKNAFTGDVNETLLPRSAEEVFDSGAVAEVIARQFGTGGDPEDVIPKIVEIVPAQDSVTIEIVGHAAGADRAARIANTAATAFTFEMNDAIGQDGAISVAFLEQAKPAVDPVELLPGGPLTLMVGLAGGILVGLGAVALLLVWRRPVLTAAAAEQASGVPVLGTVTLPRTRRGEAPPVAQMAGLAPLCRRILDEARRTVLLANAPGATTARRELALGIATMLGRLRRVRFVSPADLPSVAQAHADGLRPEVGKSGATPGGTADTVAIVDGIRPTESVELPPSLGTVLVVPEGIGLHAFQLAVSETGAAELVLVRRLGFFSRPSRDGAGGVLGRGRSGVRQDSGVEFSREPAGRGRLGFVWSWFSRDRGRRPPSPAGSS